MNPDEAVKRPLRLGVAGLGFGSGVHLPVFQAMPDVTVTAVCGRRLHKAQAVAVARSIPLAVDNITALLDSNIDAVTLALPPVVAVEAAALALERGIPVLTEKPLAPDAESAQMLAATAAVKGVTAMVDFTFQEVPTFKRLKQWIIGGQLGNVRAVNISWLTHSFAHRTGLWSWKVDGQAGGGVMAAQGSHVFHLLRWLFGSVTLEFARLDYAATLAITPTGAEPAADGAMLILRLHNNAPVIAHLSNASPGGGRHRWEVVFDGGMICVTNQGEGIMGGFSLSLQMQDGRHLADFPAPDRGGANDRLEPFSRLAMRFVAAARERRPEGPDFADGAAVQSLMTATHQLAALSLPCHERDRRS